PHRARGERHGVVQAAGDRHGGLPAAGRHHERLHVGGHQDAGAAHQVRIPGADRGQVGAGLGQRGEPLVEDGLPPLLRFQPGHQWPPLAKTVSTMTLYVTVGLSTIVTGGSSVSPNTCRKGNRTSCSAYSELSSPSAAPLPTIGLSRRSSRWMSTTPGAPTRNGTSTGGTDRYSNV